MENRRTVLVIAILAGLAAAGIGMYFNTNPSNLPSAQGNARLFIIAGAIVVLAIVFLLIKFGVGASNQRKQEWLDKADAVGDTVDLDFEEDVPKHFHRDFLFLPEIKKSGKTNRLARGSITNHDALFFEQSYVVNTGQSSHTVYHCVYATDAPNWPKLSVTPRNPFSKLFRKLGRRSGMLLDDPNFNHEFVVSCEDEPFAVTLLTPEMQRFMLGKTNTRWRITNGKVFLIYKGKLKLDRMPNSVNRLARFWSFVPPEVGAWERQGMF